MNPVKIFTDSTCDLNAAEIKKYDIQVVPLNVVFKDKTYFDGVDITSKQLYQIVEELDELPKTSAVAPGIFIKEFKKFIDQGFDIFYVGISSKLSGTYLAAAIAAKEFAPGRVIINDSLNLSSSIGLQLLKAAQLKEKGLSAVEIGKEIDDVAKRVKCSFAVNKLDYLYKGGRCSGTKYFFGRLLHAHPIIKVIDGGMIVYKTPRGNMVKALNIMIEDFTLDLNEGKVDLDTVMITHSCADESAAYIKEKLSEIIDHKHIMVTDAGCVISSHCGEKTIGILYITK